MGGEGIKALQIFLELKKLHPNTVQITHARNRSEVEGRLALPDVHFIEDDRLSVWLWKSVLFRFFLDAHFSRQAVAFVDAEIARLALDPAAAIVHQTEPNSPVVPRSISRRAINVFGPINGNIYYPPAFRKDESTSAAAVLQGPAGSRPDPLRRR